MSESIPASRASWKTLPVPLEREHFEFAGLFSDAEGERMLLGHVPDDMDDKWFVFFEDGWLYFHRSWTGHCIFGLRLDGSPQGVRVIDAWVSRDRSNYNSPGIEQETELLAGIIRWKLLKE